ncbi:unnamed protein product [Urochloa decumbens]|uniref:Uncharacterized protein n=1 Tax=Urochloa decumbens TaxID=240449 RepID=A0ABC9B8P4_9POAL
MAPLSRVLFLAAIVVVAMAILSPSPMHGQNPDCFPLPGCTNHDSVYGFNLCYSACITGGYWPQPLATCYSIPPSTEKDHCCCEK